jgi:hypothetical protein
MTPEQQGLTQNDQSLTAAGWIVQDRDTVKIFFLRTMAIREVHLRTSYADYLLAVYPKAPGLVEAPVVGTTVSGVVEQSSAKRRWLGSYVPLARG